MSKTIKILTSLKDIEPLVPKWQQASYLAIDTETDGIHRFCQVVGISIASSYTKGYYIPIKIWNNDKQTLTCPWEPQALNRIKEIMKAVLVKPNLIMHNAVFDCKVFDTWLNPALDASYGAQVVANVYCDTQLLAHTVYNEEGPLGLKPLAAELLDPNAANPQNDVKESVKANGGSITKDKFEMYKADYKILGYYAIHDTLYTYGLFEKLYPEIKKQGLDSLWHEEVLPLLQVSYELNTVGVRVDIPYFEKLKVEVQNGINELEAKIYSGLADKLSTIEYSLIKKKLKVTKRSELGKYLEITEDGDFTESLTLEQQAKALTWYKQKNNVNHILNLDSGDHKAVLLYDLLGYTCAEKTNSGKPATDADTIKELAKDTNNPNKPILDMLLHRAKEIKLLSTYIEPIIEHHVDGVIYTGFNQTGTVSGRFSSSRPINLQTLVRDDKRIKTGFIPRTEKVLIGSDYESAEPKIFAFVSGEQKLKDIFKEGLDFYSKIAIDVEGFTEYSANSLDKNFLKEVAPKKRTKSKAYALGLAYGMRAGKLGMTLGISYQEADELVKAYRQTYPNLADWMDDSEVLAYSTGFVTTITGRKRRTPLVYTLYNDYKVKDFSKRNLEKFWDWGKARNLALLEPYKQFIEFYLSNNNALNNAKNFQIQGLAGSICNQAMIDFSRAAKNLGLTAKIILQIHDEIVVECPKEEANKVAELLQSCMEHNRVTKMIDVPMKAEPVITDKSLAEAK